MLVHSQHDTIENNNIHVDVLDQHRLEVINHLTWIKKQVEKNELWVEDIISLNICDSPSMTYYIKNNLPILSDELINYINEFGYIGLNNGRISYICKL